MIDGTATTRVAFVTQWFPPEPASYALEIAEGIRNSKFAVAVQTGVPNYPDGIVHPGYNQWRPSREVIAGLPIVRAPMFANHGLSGAGRALNYVTFAAGATLTGRRWMRSADVSLVYGSPATAALPAMVAKKLHGVPYVLFIQDLWPDSVAATGFAAEGSLVQRGLPAVERFVNLSYQMASEIAVITPGMKRTLIERGVPESKITVVYNWTDESEGVEVDEAEGLRARLNIPESDLVLVYAGNHGPAQALGSWIEAMRILAPARAIHLVLMGDGVSKSELIKQADGLSNVHFVDAVPREYVRSALADVDALVVSLANKPLFEITLPGKVQSCLETGKPIVASVAGDAADVIGSSGGGWYSNPEDPVAISEMVARVASLSQQELVAAGARGRDFYYANMSRSRGVDQMRKLLLEASRERSPLHGNQV